MDLFHSLAGMLQVELTSAEPERAVDGLAKAGIRLYRVRMESELSYSFQILRRDREKLERLCEKRGDSVRFTGKRGLYWLGKAALERPILVGGAAVLLAATLFLPTRILFVEVTGAEKLPRRQILEAAADCGIRFGVSRRAVRSEKMKNTLLSALPELQWAGVNTAGCVATISVRERADNPPKPEDRGVSSIVAARDGFILSGTVVQGNGLFQVGQAVRKGDVLISGYTDCGLTVRATPSEGEIMAQTSRSVEAVTPTNWLFPGEAGGVRRKISLLLGKKRIILWKDSGILDATCGRMYAESYVTLPGGWRLPVALCVERFPSRSWEEAALLPEQARDSLGRFAESQLREQMVAGTILAKLQAFSQEEGRCRLTGEYICKEMIGRLQREQIGDTNGKSG